MVSEIEKREVTQVIHDSIAWAITKDFNRLFSIVAQNQDFFIYHPDSSSTIRGFDSFKTMIERSFSTDSFKATDYAVKDLRLVFSKIGDCAWWSCMLDDHCEWNGKPGGWEDYRWTGVLEKQEGQWVIAQMHFSFPKND